MLTHPSVLSVGICLAAFLIGWWQGASSTEEDYQARIKEYQLELTNAQLAHADEVRAIEAKYQKQITALDENVYILKEQSRTEINRLNLLIDGYRVRENNRAQSDADAVPSNSSPSCGGCGADTDKWRKAFVRLSELARDLAVERDELAGIKNNLVTVYQGLRDGTQDYTRKAGTAE